MNKNPIYIVCATDIKYAPFCGIMLTSLLENNRDREVIVFILVDKSLPKKELDKFSCLSNKYGATLSFIMVDNSFFKRFPLKGDGISHWSIVTYYRIYAADLLPDYVDHVLYLDCDIIVNRPIGELFDMNWDTYAVGAIPDMCIEWQEYYDRLGYARDDGYYNAGVVFINLEYWRLHKVGELCLDFLINNYDRIYNNDQDVLNVVTRNCKKNLPVSFNYQMQLLMPYFFNTFKDDLKQEILETSNPHIIHYAAELKPWMTKYYFYPFNSEWHKYKKISPWNHLRDQLPKGRAFQGFIKRYILWPLGIMEKRPQLVR